MPPPSTPKTPGEIDLALTNLASNFADYCETVALPALSAKPPGTAVKALRIHHPRTEVGDPAALVIGGLHAREWAPPDALLRFADQLLTAYDKKTDIVFPPLTARAKPPIGPAVSVAYPDYKIPFTTVEKIVKTLDLYVLPCVNPDGRLFDLTKPAEFWRKNRRPNPDDANKAAIGVDLNRNFDIAWDFEEYYDMPMYRTVYSGPPASGHAREETFNGVTDPVRTVRITGGPTEGSFLLEFDGKKTAPIAFNADGATVRTRLAALSTVGGAANVDVTGGPGGPYTVTFKGARNHPVGMLIADYSGLKGGSKPRVAVEHADHSPEPEVLNVQWLVNTKKVRFFLDVHQFGRAIMVPWGLEDSGDTEAMNFQAAAWNGQRDGLLAANVPGGRTNYDEFFPNGFPYFMRDKHDEVANSMRDAILTAAGANLAAAEGADPRADHSRYKVGTSARFYHPVNGGPVTGTSDDYAFSRQFVHPDRYPVYSFAMEVGHDEEQGFHPDYGAPNNHYPKIEREVHAAVTAFLTAAARWCRFCVVATAAFGSEHHPDVAFLRGLRDRELRSTPLGRRFAAALDRVYYSFSPPLARQIHHRRRARAVVRALLVRPVVVALRGAVLVTRPLRPDGLRVACLSVLVTLSLAAPLLALLLAFWLAARGG